MDFVADAVFLRRILFAMIGLTMLTGVLATLTAVEAINPDPSICAFDCPAGHVPIKITSADDKNLGSP